MRMHLSLYSIYAQHTAAKIKLWNKKISYEYRVEQGKSGFAKPSLEHARLTLCLSHII